MRLIGESRVECDLDQRALLVNPLPCEFETAHEQVAVGAGSEHDPELPRQVVACQSGDRLAFLLWLAWKIATSGSRIDSAPDRDPVGYLGAAIFQWVNPKSWLVTASAAGTFLSAEAGSPIVQAASLAGLFVLAALPSCFLWLAFGAAVQHVLHSRSRLRVFNIAMGALLALSIVLIVR
jgi:hypothetical protein